MNLQLDGCLFSFWSTRGHGRAPIAVPHSSVARGESVGEDIGFIYYYLEIGPLVIWTGKFILGRETSPTVIWMGEFIIGRVFIWMDGLGPPKIGWVKPYH